MHPLSIFPGLFTYELFAALLLRLIVSSFLLFLGRKRQTKQYPIASLLYYASGALVLFGLYTQPASLVAILVLAFDFYTDFYKNKMTSPISKETYFLFGFALLILVSLLLTGPGAFAFDLPL